MKGDRERCLAAGMDGYVSKPVKLEDLIEATENLYDTPGQGLETHISDVMDLEVALARVDGDEALLVDLAKIFCDESRKLLSAVENALLAKKTEELKRAAHSLKGSVATFAAAEPTEAVSKLEEFARVGDLDSAKEVYPFLEASVERLKRALESLANGHAGSLTPVSSFNRSV